MGTTGDIRKALKVHGFKLLSTNKHAVYQNAEGRVVRLHLGSSISDMKYRTVMKDIERGNVMTGKVAKERPTAIWTKETARVYVLVRGNREVGRAVQVNGASGWGWEVYCQPNETVAVQHHGPFKDLDAARAFLESL